MSLLGSPQPPRPDGTEGTALVQLTIQNDPQRLDLRGCFIHNDENFKKLINDDTYIEDHKNTKFFIYFGCSLYKSLENNLVKTDITVHRFTKPDRDKSCTIEHGADGAFVYKDCHVFLPACHEELKTNEILNFLKAYSKKIPSQFFKLTIGQYKGLTRVRKFKFVDITLNLTTNNKLVMDDSSFNTLVDGPLLDSNEVVGYYFKESDGSRITVNMLGTQDISTIWTNLCNVQQSSGPSTSGGEQQNLPEASGSSVHVQDQPNQPQAPGSSVHQANQSQVSRSSDLMLDQPNQHQASGSSETDYDFKTPFSARMSIKVNLTTVSQDGRRNFDIGCDFVVSACVKTIAAVVASCGAIFLYMLTSSIKIVIEVSTLNNLHALWKSYKSKELHKKLEEVILTDDLMKLAPEGTDEIEVSVDISYHEYREARLQFLTEKERMLGASSRRSLRPPLRKRRTLPPMNETTYYLKLCKLVVKIGRPVLQDVFDAVHPPATLPGVLSTPKIRNKLLQLQRKNVLYQSQMDILYPPPKSGSVTSANFDISLLIVLLRNICNIASPTDAVWKKKPLPTHISQAADIVRIKLLRNDLYHRNIQAMTESDFDAKWDEIKDAIIRLGGREYEEDIQRIKTESCYEPEIEEIEEDYRDLLRSREEVEQLVVNQKAQLLQLQEMIKEIECGFTSSSYIISTSVEIDIKTKFKLFAAGAVTIGWAAGCMYFLNRYKDDPDKVIGLVQRAIIPSTFAVGATMVHSILTMGIPKYGDVQSILAGSVDPDVEKRYPDLLRSKEEEIMETLEEISALKTWQQDLEQKVHDIVKLYAEEININTTFKVFAAGTATLGWAALSVYFLYRYKDDPEKVIGLVQRAIIPSTIAVGAAMVGICRGKETKYEEVTQNLVRSVDHSDLDDLLRSREETEEGSAEETPNLKSVRRDLIQELEDIVEKHDEKNSTLFRFRYIAAAALTIGCAAGCTYFLNRYKDDPEAITSLVHCAIVPDTIATVATVAGVFYF